MDGNTLFCEIYTKNLNNMMIKINEAKTELEILMILIEFAEMFTMLPDQQLGLLRLSRLCDYNLPDDLINCLFSKSYGDKNAKHVEWSSHQDINISLHEGVLPKRFQIAEQALSFPHNWLLEVYANYVFHAVKPITVKQQNQQVKNVMIYHKMKACENNTEKWLECIKEIKDKEVVIANLELKLGQSTNWKNKKLWKFYFDFLKENNLKEILQVFRKYTRLFICDKQAVRQYRKTIEKLSSPTEPQTKYWIDTVKYEMIFGTIENAYAILERALKAVFGKPFHFVVKDEKDLYEKLEAFEKETMQHERFQQSEKTSSYLNTISLRPTVYFQYPEQQCFCFHQSFIYNILKNANETILSKLYSSCKFFYALKKAPLCYRLEICDKKKTSYCQKSLYVNEKDINFCGLRNLHVYGIFAIYNSSIQNTISHILPKLMHCNVCHIYLKKQNFSVSEFKFMLSKNVSQIMLLDVNIYKKSGNGITAAEVFKILKSYPSLKTFEFFNQSFFIVGSSIRNDRLRWVIPHLQNQQFETIYIAKQHFSVWNLQHIINYQLTKYVTLKHVTVNNGDGTIIEKQQLNEFILSNVNPTNDVSVKII